MNRHRIIAPGISAAIGLTLALAACGGGASPSPAAATPPPASVAPASEAPTGDAVTISGFTFAPASLTVKVGTTVTWTNEDSARHTVKWDDGSKGSDTLTKGGATYARTFDSPGTFGYACGIHAVMKGTVVVEP
jgi:plastocyanin